MQFAQLLSSVLERALEVENRLPVHCLHSPKDIDIKCLKDSIENSRIDLGAKSERDER